MVPHYGLRKLSVGVASVLLGTTIYGYNVAHADTLSVGNTNENEKINAGEQVPYQEGKNVNALNDNGRQANNQDNVVNDQQTPYADSLAVLDLNNNYQNVGSQYVEREVSESKVAVSGNSNDPRITGKWMTTQKDTSTNNETVVRDIKPSFQWDKNAVTASVPTIDWNTSVSSVFNSSNIPSAKDLTDKYSVPENKEYSTYVSNPNVLLRQWLRANPQSEAVAVNNNMVTVATETFNNLGDSFFVRNDGTKVKIGQVKRIYFEPKGNGVLLLSKTARWGDFSGLSYEEASFIYSPFGQIGTIYGDISSIGVRNVFYDTNGHVMDIPIENDVMYIRGIHNHWALSGVDGSTVYPGVHSGYGNDAGLVLGKGDGGDIDSVIVIGSSNGGFRYGASNATWQTDSFGLDGHVKSSYDHNTGKLEPVREEPGGKVSVEFSNFVPSNLGYKKIRTSSYRRTINLLDQNGNVIADPIIQQASWNDFSKDGNTWVSDNTFKYVDAVIPPHIDGYITNAKVIPPVQGISRDHAGNDIVNVYYVSKRALLPELDTNDAYALNPKNNMHEHKNVNDNGGFDKDYWGTVDPTCWNYSIAGDTITLENLKNVKLGDKGIIVPNIADFRAEDLDHDAKRVVISKALLSNLAFQYSRIGMSKTDNQKIGISGSSLDHAFANSSVEVMDLHNLDISNVQALSYFAFGTSNLRTIGDISGWNTSNVTDMKNMFASANSLIDLGDIGNWDVSNVTDMSAMFSNARALRNMGKLDSWNVSSVIAMNGMFRDAHSLTDIGNLSGWDVGKVQNMDGIFSGASGLRSLDISNWNLMTLSSYFSFNNMFDRDPYLCLIANNVKLPSYYSGLLTNHDIFSDHMAVITDNDQLLKSTGNTDDYTIDGQKFTQSIFYQSNGSADAVSVIKAANQKLMDGYTAKHPDKLLKYDSSQNMTDPIALANASFVTVPNNVDTTITFVSSDSHLAGSDLVLNGPSQTKIDPNGVKIPDGYILDGSLPDMYYGNNYTIKLKRKQIPIPSNDPSVKCGIQLHVSFNVPQKYQNDPQYRSHSIDYNYSRTGYTDGVTGQKVFTPWRTNPAISAVTIPSLAGYSTSWNIAGPSSDKGTGEVISADFLDKLFKQFLNANTVEPSVVYSLAVTYTPNQQSQLINYVDTTTGKTIHQQMVNGVTDQTVNVTSEVPANWKLANGQTFPTSITLANNSSPLTVKITHQINSLNPPAYGPYPFSTLQSDWYRTVKHIVNFEVPSKYVSNPLYKQVVQTINFSRKGEVDAVTGKVSYFDWQQDNKFMNVTVPALLGYTSSETTVIAPAVNADSKDIITNVTYTPNQQSQLINYVDATSGKTIHQQSVNGVMDQTVSVANEVPTNWKLADGQTLPSSITLTNNPSLLTVKVTHVINPANPSPDGPFPAGTQKSDWYRTVRHIINFKVPSKYADNPLYKQIVQTINFSRKGQIDAVTGKVDYFDWQQDNKFMNVTVPGLDGYTPSQTTVIAPVVNADSKDVITDVTYAANPSSVRISYLDNDNHEISHQDFSGVMDQDVKISAQLPANWKLASGQQVPEAVTLLARPRTIQVVVEHIVNNVQPGENGPWPGNTQKSDWYRTVTRTINFKVPDKYSNQSQFKTIVQTANFKRSGHLDTVTNMVKFDAWQRTGQFDVVKVPGLTGYTTNYVTVDQAIPGADDQNSVVDVTYTPKAESQLINYVDANGQVIHRQKVDGKMDDTIKVTPDIPAHWKLSQGVSVPGTITLTDQPAALSYQIEHIIDNLTPSKNGPYPHGTKKSDWFRMVTRTINFTVPDKYGKEPQFKTITQTVNFKRTGHYDQALAKVSFDSWQRIGQFDAVKVPQLFGYTTSTDQVVGEVPTENSSNQTVNVTYAPQTATLQINFVTPDGQQVSHVDDKGIFDMVIDLGINWHNDLPSGYQIYDRNIDQDLGSLSIDFLTKTINVVVVPTQTMKTQIKTVTRRIHLQMPNGAEQVVTQSAIFTRQLTMQTGSKDPVEVGAWSPDAWLVAYQPSHLDGYTIDNVKSVLVSGDSNDQDVYLNYQAIAQPTTVTFALINGQIVDSVKVDDLKTAQVSNLIPKGYHLLNSEDGASRLLVEPDMVTYNGNMSNVPSNVGELKRTVKRTIIMTLANGRTRRIVQQVRFTRTATVNQATGEIMYGDWHAVGSGKFNRINVPKRAGKTIRILGGNVNAVAVNANMHDSVVRVRYI